MLKVGVIGLGTVSVVHVRGIQESPMAELAAVCDIDESKRLEEPGVPFYTDYKEMLEKENLDAVHICLPHYLHDSAALECAKAGVHVLLEKPVSIDYPSSQILADEITGLDNGAKVAVCFQNRLNKSVQVLKDILETKDTSPIYAVKGLVTWFRPADYYIEKKWRGTWEEAGAGTIINQSIHTLDLMHYVLHERESDWKQCKAQMSNLLDYEIEVEDTASANFLFKNDVRGLFFATNAYYGNDSVELQVITEKSRYTIKDNKLFDDDGKCLAEDDTVPGSKIYYGPSHKSAMEEFYWAIIEDTDNYCSIHDALQTMQMVDAIKLSSELSKTITKEDITNGENWSTGKYDKRQLSGERSL